MIRMNPAHDTSTPPGCINPQQQNVIHQEKTLEKEILIYQKGYLEGYTAATKEATAKISAYITRTSEHDR